MHGRNVLPKEAQGRGCEMDLHSKLSQLEVIWEQRNQSFVDNTETNPYTVAFLLLMTSCLCFLTSTSCLPWDIRFLLNSGKALEASSCPPLPSHTTASLVSGRAYSESAPTLGNPPGEILCSYKWEQLADFWNISND